MPTAAHAPAVLVTGAAGGIGSALTRSLAARGYRVYAGVRAGGEHLKAIPEVRVVSLDVTDRESIRAAAGTISAEQEGLRAVVNNAGIMVTGPLELVSADDLRRQFAVNVDGVVAVTQELLPLLREGRGRLVNISAPTARVAIPFAGPISASKAALEALSDAARLELAPFGIRVVVVVPGAIETPIFAKAGAGAEETLRQADPARRSLYNRQLEAIAAAQSRMKMSGPQSVADAVIRAIEARKPDARYVVNRDARAAFILARLPVRTRDRILEQVLGLRKATVNA